MRVWAGTSAAVIVSVVVSEVEKVATRCYHHHDLDSEYERQHAERQDSLIAREVAEPPVEVRNELRVLALRKKLANDGRGRLGKPLCRWAAEVA